MNYDVIMMSHELRGNYDAVNHDIIMMSCVTLIM